MAQWMNLHGTVYCVALLCSNLAYPPSAMAGRHVGRQMKYK